MSARPFVRFVSSAVVIAAVCACRGPAQPAPSDGRPSSAASVDDEAEVAVPEVDVTSMTLSHATPYIPPQCYTKTVDASGRAHNPCFTCHQRPTSPNYLDDADLQQALTFIPAALDNPWTNLFVDRREAVAAVPDEEILAYVRRSNYFDDDGSITLAKLRTDLPSAWDVDRDGTWDGFVPDAYFDFDDRGFDHAPDGALTGWRAFAYYPFPGTFWPTNGSTGDVLIRLPDAFRRDAGGAQNVETYTVNLAVVEALIARRDVPIAPTDEGTYGVDLDGDGKLGEATVVRHVADASARDFGHLVGEAGTLQDAGKIRLRPGLYPEGTEFLHTVRYIDVVDGKPMMAARMKEVRYARKTRFFEAGQLQHATSAEFKEAHDFPDRAKEIGGSAERGINNAVGWTLAGFIEDAEGQLRPQTREEHAYCVGCHGGIGGIEDSIFSFRRKLPPSAHAGGWYHWTQRGLEGTPEPVRADGEPEYAHYLRHNGAGDEFRSNEEILARFFDEDGSLAAAAVVALRGDISTLLLPSPARALELDKAYREIVREQSFIRGRDATVAPADHVWRRVEADQATGIEVPITGPRTGASGEYPSAALAIADP